MTSKTYTLGRAPGSDYAGTVRWTREGGSGPLRYGDSFSVALEGAPEPVNGPVGRLVKAGRSHWTVYAGGPSYTFAGTLESAAISLATAAIENARHAARKEARS